VGLADVSFKKTLGVRNLMASWAIKLKRQKKSSDNPEGTMRFGQISFCNVMDVSPIEMT